MGGIELADASGMSKAIPQIQKYMTSSPITIGMEQTVAHAHQVMREHRIRHLPVLHGGKVVGLLSERDVALIESLKDVDPQKVTVEEAMTQSPYTTTPDMAIDHVAREMAEHKYGAAIVVSNNHVVGVFTTVDACRTLAEIFDGRLK